MATVKNVIKALSNPIVQETIKNNFGNLVGQVPGVPILQNAVIPEPIAPVVSTSSSDSNFIQTYIGVIIGILLLWGVIMIILNFILKDKENKDNVKYIHHVLFGSSGLIYIILLLLIVHSVYLSLPSLSSIASHLGDLLKNILPVLLKL